MPGTRATHDNVWSPMITCATTTTGIARSVLLAALTLGGTAVLAPAAAAEEPAPKKSVAKFEIDFMEDTIRHHNLAIEMGELCVAGAVGDDQLPELCANVVQTQTQQRDLLQAWLLEWYGVTPPSDTELPPMGDQMLAKLARYDGEEFDTEMAETFIRHHFTFLPDADKCRDTAYHAPLAGLCDTMYNAQLGQIPQFRAVVAESSGRENFGPKGQPGGSSQRGSDRR